MNWPHIHLMINHFPVVGLFLSIPLLVLAIVKKSEDLEQAALGAFVLIALATVPVYLTGEASQNLVELLPGVSKGLIDTHEEAADLALVLILLLGAVALGGLIFELRSKKVPRWFLVLVLAFALAVSGVTGLVANLGGKIRHPEVREGFVYPSGAVPEKGQQQPSKQ